MCACTHTHTYTHPISPSSVRSFCPAVTLPPSPDVLCSTSSIPRAWYLSFLQNLLLCSLHFPSWLYLSFLFLHLMSSLQLLAFFWLKLLPRQIQKHTINCWFRNPPRSHNKRRQVQIITHHASAESPRLCSRERNMSHGKATSFAVCAVTHKNKRINTPARTPKARAVPPKRICNTDEVEARESRVGKRFAVTRA